MKNTMKVLAVIMAALMLALSCAVVLAGDDEREEPTRPSIVTSKEGTYLGRRWTLNTSAGTATKIKSTGTYAVDEYMQLKFNPTFMYSSIDGYVILPGDEGSLDYGNYFTDSLTKSYTVAQAAAHFYLGSIPYSQFLPDTAVFSKCKYSLRLDSNTVCSFTVNY